jgi:hypothetical protein
MNGKKLTELTRGELLENCERLIEALAVSRSKVAKAQADLPLNKRANARHQRMKHAWGRRKKRLLALLDSCRPFVDPDLNEKIDYEFEFEEHTKEMSFQRRTHIDKRRAGMSRVSEDSLNNS